jgi:membrane-bound lytic murein transglycosylase B
VVERAGLENRNTRKRIVGSNPTLSATRYPARPASWPALLLALVMAPMDAAAQVQRALSPDTEVFIGEMAQKHQFDERALRKLFVQVRPLPSILRAVSAPATARPWHEFRARNVDPARISGGVAFWREHSALLARARERYGVPEEIIVATIGIETLYGRNTGSFRVLEALTTLAFNYPPRAGLFRGELEAYLLMVREGGLDAMQARGSYAGAMGIPQFLPSSFRRYAVDFDGDGRRDLMNVADAIGSVANYYREFGWQPGGNVVVPVTVAAADTEALLAAGIKPHLKVAELRRLGITPAAPVDESAEAALLTAETESGPRYWLGLNNFYVITRYNRSVNYALAVHELARELRALVRPGE